MVLTLMLISPFLLQGQNPKVVRINPKEVATCNLSQIAEKVTPISLSSYKDLYRNGAEFFYITDDYLFIIGVNAIGRLDISWKYIETGYKTGYFRGDGGITSITGDPDKKEIYFCTNSKVVCCDYSLTIKKVFGTKYNTNSIFFYNNKLCIASYELNESVKGVRITYRISSMDVVTGKEKFFPFEISETSQGEKWGLFIQKPIFSVYNDQIVYSNVIDSTLYGIKGDSIYPLKQYVIEPITKYMISSIQRQGFIGKNLYLEYRMSSPMGPAYGNSFIYLEDTETGKGYNLNETFNDDLYHTGNCRPDCFANKPGYFIVRREVSDLKKSFNLKIPTDSPAIYIVKMKSLNPQVKNVGDWGKMLINF